MKYFTPEWHGGGWSYDKVDAVIDAYQRHLDSIDARLTDDLRVVCRKISLHDGLIQYAVLDTSAETLDLRLRCGNLNTGYFDLDLTYSDVAFDEEECRALKELCAPEYAELLYDEVDVTGTGRFVHRLLFWVSNDTEDHPYRRFSIEFDGLRHQITPQLDREFEETGPRFRLVYPDSG